MIGPEAFKCMGVAHVTWDFRPGDSVFPVAGNVGALNRVRELDQAFGIWERQGTQEHAFDYRKSSCGRADSKRKHQDDGQTQSGRLDQVSDGNSQLMKKHVG